MSTSTRLPDYCCCGGRAVTDTRIEGGLHTANADEAVKQQKRWDIRSTARAALIPLLTRVLLAISKSHPDLVKSSDTILVIVRRIRPSNGIPSPISEVYAYLRVKGFFNHTGLNSTSFSLHGTRTLAFYRALFFGFAHCAAR